MAGLSESVPGRSWGLVKHVKERLDGRVACARDLFQQFGRRPFTGRDHLVDERPRIGP